MKSFYVWIGQNATTGTPNRITGRMSMYGHFKKFKTAKARNEYIDQWRSNNPSEYIVKCSLSSGRQYDLGCSYQSYEEYMNYLDYTVKARNVESGRTYWVEWLAANEEIAD